MKTTTIIVACFSTAAFADVGVGRPYRPPYDPRKCSNALPADGKFIAAGSAIWNSGATCGQYYEVVCLSGNNGDCHTGTFTYPVVDGKLGRRRSRATMFFSEAAAADLFNGTQEFNIEFRQV